MDNSQVIIQMDRVSKQYPLYKGRYGMLKSFLFPSGNNSTGFFAVKDVSLAIRKGEIVGLIGLNGSGKSTLIRMIAGITKQTEGNLTVKGTTDILVPGAGLNNKLTGRENIRYKCLLLGYSRKKIRKMEEEIIRFAEVDSYIDQPLRTYSSGMRARLGFAISIQTNPDILLIDEALAVGDTGFVKKCKDRINTLREDGKTILFVSHAVDQMKSFCTRTVWLHSGIKVAEGDTGHVIHAYKAFVDEYYAASPEERKELRPCLTN